MTYYLFCTNSFKYGMNFTVTAYLNLDIKFLSELLALYLEFIKMYGQKDRFTYSNCFKQKFPNN